MAEPDDELVSVQCPYCGELQSIVLDPESIGEMVQDCEVCCEPWQMNVRRGRVKALLIFSACLMAVAPAFGEGEDGSLVLPKPIHRVGPRPPASFRNLGFEAHVVLNANVTDTGAVESVGLISCKSWAPGETEFQEQPAKRCEPFIKSATDAVMKWTYQPASRNGVPVSTFYSVTVNFTHKPKS